MVMTTRSIFVAVSLAVVGLATPAASLAKDTIVIAIPGTPQGIDLDRQAGPQSWTMAGQVIELGAEWAPIAYPFKPVAGADPTKIPGFSYPNFASQELSPALFESCELSPDGLSATYHLRKGVKSAAGNEFDADDVLWRVERAHALKAIGAFLQTAANANDPGQWKKIDDHTVRITAEKPMPLVCKILANLYWYWFDSREAKKHVTADDPWATKWISTGGVGFGPYTIDSWEAGKRVVMKANPNYWKGVPSIKRIIYLVVPDSTNRVALLRQGKVDLVEGISPDEAVALSSDVSLRVAAVRGNQSIYAVMNNTKPPFDDPKVRQAINAAIPRAQIVNDIYRGLAEPWQGVMPSTYPGYIPVKRYDFNVEEAKKLLSESKSPSGFKTTLAFSAGDPVQENIAVLLKSVMAPIGIDIALQKMPVAAHSDQVQSKNADFALWVDFPIQPDPNYSLGLMYGSGNAVNYQNYSNAEVDRILKEGTSIVDGAKRNEFHAPAEDQISKDATIGWIAEPYYVNAMTAKLSGWKWFTTQYYKVSEMQVGD
jgi:peptide/nickel transport system substrate-binding protein